MGIIKKIWGKIFPTKTTSANKVRRGLFTPQQQKILAKKADDKAHLTGLKEKLDGPVFLASIWLLDDLVFDKLPEELKTKLYPVIDMIFGRME